MNRRLSLYCMMIVIVLSMTAIMEGCETRTTQEPLPEKEKEVSFVPILAPEGKNPFEGKDPGVMSPIELERIQKDEAQSTLLSFRIDSAIVGAKTWEGADQFVRARLDEIKELRFAYQVEQVAANKMLSIWLLQGERTDDKDRAVAFYTDLLLKNNHPDAVVIGEALEHLRSRWPEAQISQAAAKTVRNAQQYLQKNPCKPCLEGLIVSEEALDAQQRKLYRMSHAVTTLAKMTSGQ